MLSKGTLLNYNSTPATEVDREVIKMLRTSCDARNSTWEIQWPGLSEEPLDEFGPQKIFCMSFPWLFPGGIGDIKCDRKINLQPKEWAKHLLRLADGRFARDQTWCFYALNYVNRRRNIQQGKWFADNMVDKNITTLKCLQEKVAKHQTSFVPKLLYFGSAMLGSDAYWRNQRQELLSWIFHHMDVGNGPPSLFITLSCAEYHWKDIQQLLNQRHSLKNTNNLNLNTKTGRIRACNEYALVIQEYFQERVQHFMNTVAKTVFGIHHYWCRFEFAKSRGQIHAHILCMQGKESHIQNPNTLMHMFQNSTAEQDDAVAKWAEETFGLTACTPSGSDPLPQSNSQRTRQHPCGSRLRDQSNYNEDLDSLITGCQLHTCSRYCLKKTKTGMKVSTCYFINQLNQTPPNNTIFVILSTVQIWS